MRSRSRGSRPRCSYPAQIASSSCRWPQRSAAQRPSTGESCAGSTSGSARCVTSAARCNVASTRSLANSERATPASARARRFARRVSLHPYACTLLACAVGSVTACRVRDRDRIVPRVPCGIARHSVQMRAPPHMAGAPFNISFVHLRYVARVSHDHVQPSLASDSHLVAVGVRTCVRRILLSVLGESWL